MKQGDTKADEPITIEEFEQRVMRLQIATQEAQLREAESNARRADVELEAAEHHLAYARWIIRKGKRGE